MTTQNKSIYAESVKKTKIETTYEYVPIIGQILGYWRKASDNRIGETIELHIKTPISEYDKLLINGVEIPLTTLKNNK